jgi:hypothetical protein
MSTTSSQESGAEMPSLNDQVIEQFLTELAAVPSFEGVAARLRKTVLEDRILSEDAIRKALFDEGPA